MLLSVESAVLLYCVRLWCFKVPIEVFAHWPSAISSIKWSSLSTDGVWLVVSVASCADEGIGEFGVVGTSPFSSFESESFVFEFHQPIVQIAQCFASQPYPLIAVLILFFVEGRSLPSFRSDPP